MLRRDVPASATAYEFYLRANQLSLDREQWTLARDLCLRALEQDPGYAPAWARLGRMYRVIAKFSGSDQDRGRAEDALKRALEINPDLSAAHSLYAQLEVDLGRATDAMARLIARAQSHSAEPELFAGLVYACRYGGLLDSSVRAHEMALRLDGETQTSVAHTYLMREALAAFNEAGGARVLGVSS